MEDKDGVYGYVKCYIGGYSTDYTLQYQDKL